VSLNVLALCTALWLLSRILMWHGRPRLRLDAESKTQPRAAVPHFLRASAKFDAALLWMLVLVSMPCIMALGHAQNTCTSLLILTVAVTFWRSKRAFFAGLVGGVLCYKPQLAAVLAGAMVMTLGARALAGLCVSGGSLLLAGERAMPGSTLRYLRQLPLNLRFMQVEHPYLWERHVTLRALWRMLIQGRGPGETSMVVTALTGACGVALLVGLFIAWRRGRETTGDVPWTGETAAIRRDRFIAAVIVATPLLMPFYFDYDLLLLTVPAVLYAREMMSSDALGTRDARRERRLLITWSIFYLWLFVNPGITAKTRVNGTGLLLACLAVQHIARACRVRTLAAPAHVEHFLNVSVAPLRRAA
jgi:hypothetical protein